MSSTCGCAAPTSNERGASARNSPAVTGGHLERHVVDGEALTRMAAAVKNFKLESVSNADLAWVAVGRRAGVSHPLVVFL
jgi:hypothetical protein